MAMARYTTTKSDRWIKEKIVQHIGGVYSDRKLIRQRLDNGYIDGGENHCIYYLHGSPIKAWAVRKRGDLHFYDGTGKRWATYNLAAEPPIKHEISYENSEFLGGSQ